MDIKRDDMWERRAKLSGAKRTLLEKRLQGKLVSDSKTQAIPRRSSIDPAPLSFAQQRLWFLHQLNPNIPTYNQPVALHMKGLLNAEALKNTINEIIRRHEALRTTFVMHGEQPVQVIKPTLTVQIPVVNLCHLPVAKHWEEVHRLHNQEAQCPFDLATGPLVRSMLLQLDEQEYVLLLVVHHIISDGWSMRAIVRELGVLYNSFTTGKPSPLPELPIQYPDFAVWQREWLQGEIRSKQLAYWRQQLAGAPTILDLPTDRPRPPVQSFRGAIESFQLPLELTQKLKLLSQRQEATLFMTLLAAFQTLLYRYTGQEDILIGSPIANRDRRETENLVGLFANIIVLRGDLSGNPTFQEFLGRVRERTMSAYAHENLPFEQLVEELQPERHLSHTPLLQVVFVFLPDPTEGLELPGLTLNRLETHSGTSKFDLTLYMEDTKQGLTALLEYNTDLFDASTIKRMARHFQTLLEHLVANPQASLLDFPLLTKAEQQQLLVEWNNTEADTTTNSCIHTLFEAQASRTPNAVAIVFENEQLTYQELNQKSNQLAHHLKKLGVEPEVLVGICVERSVEMVVGILGILKAGGAYVPIDPAYPQPRQAFILKDAQIQVLLTQHRFVTTLPEHPLRLVCLDSDWKAISQERTNNPNDNDLTPNNLAYVIYTSGSTGQPKGVLITHANVVRLLQATQSWYHFNERDVWTLFHSYAFDFSVWELWGALFYGGRVVVVPYWVSRTPQKFCQLLCEEQVTVLNQTPSAFRQLMQEEEFSGKTFDWKLRLVIFGGEALDIKSLKPWFDRYGNDSPQLVNMYGITETTVHVTYRPLKVSDLTIASSSVIGRPIPDLQVYVLDSNCSPVPIGVPGEMHVSGAGLARGYLNRPELTSEKFIPNPFSHKPGARLYKSGDLVRYLPNGDLDYLGRIDHQVKVRGFRIELGEIEAVLSQHPAVREAIVVASEEQSGNKSLVAYIVPSHEFRTFSTQDLPLINELRNYSKQQLPDYMIPLAFVLLEALPLTLNGKLDRQALPPAPDALQHELEANFVAPKTLIEEVLAGIWSHTLGIKQVGIYDNFFELGGHSLLATQVVSQIRKAFQVDLPLLCLFESPTVASLALGIETAMKAQQHISETVPIHRVSREVDLPLSFAQQRLWFLHQLEPNSTAYNGSNTLFLQGSLNVEALARSAQEIVRRHEVLRTAFVVVEGQPVQRIAEDLTVSLPIIDLQHLSETERKAELQRLAQENAQQPFDLTSPPLLRLILLRIKTEEHILLVTMHHIISDGWSAGVFIREISALYEAFSTKKPSPLPELHIQYADFAVWQQQWLQGEVLDSQIGYWKKQLEGSQTVLELPTDRPRSLVQTSIGTKYSFTVPPTLAQSLKVFSQQEGATLFMTLVASFNALLYRYTLQEDILIGTPIANRNRNEIEGLIGFFVNTLVLRTQLSNNPSFKELLQRVREAALNAYTHQDLPFEKLIAELQPERYLDRTPLFQVWFVLQNAPMSNFQLPRLNLKFLEADSEMVRHDLKLDLTETSEGIKGFFEYKTDLFDTSTIAQMAELFKTLLAAVVEQPNLKLSQLVEILNKAEKQQQILKNQEFKQARHQKLRQITRKPITDVFQ